MAFGRIKPLGWAFMELLTSGQMTQLDIDHANSLDGLGGGSSAAAFTWSGIQTYAGAGRRRRRTVDLIDANQNFGIADGDIFFLPQLSANRTYGVLDTGGQTGALGEEIRIVGAFNTNGFTAHVTFGTGSRDLLNTGTNVVELLLTWHGATWIESHAARRS